MTGEVAAGQHLAHLVGGLGAPAGHQMFIGGGAVSVAQVQVHQSVAHPPRHVQGVGAGGGGVREVQGVVSMVAVDRVVGRREG